MFIEKACSQLLHDCESDHEVIIIAAIRTAFIIIKRYQWEERNQPARNLGVAILPSNLIKSCS